jgi:Leucine-rich repeat (LRR) protein
MNSSSPLQKIVFIHRILKFVLASKPEISLREVKSFFPFAFVNCAWREAALYYSCPPAVWLMHIPYRAVNFVLEFSGLHTIHFRKMSPEKIEETLPKLNAEKLISLRKISLAETYVMDKPLQHLLNPLLLELDLRSTLITDAALISPVSALTSLQLLDVSWNNKITDTGLNHLSGLTSLQSLHLNNTKVTDDCVSTILHFTSLQLLDLSGTQLSDRGFEQLCKISSLQHLFLSNTQITDDGLAHITEIPSLLRLHLQGTTLSDTGLQHLAGCRQLQELDLSETKITDDGLVNLLTLRSLQCLFLSDNLNITDRGMEHLAKLESLEDLFLSRTGITDAGVLHLVNLPLLSPNRVYMNNTKVTKEGKAAFQKQLRASQRENKK